MDYINNYKSQHTNVLPSELKFNKYFQSTITTTVLDYLNYFAKVNGRFILQNGCIPSLHCKVQPVIGYLWKMRS